ncbi:MAG: hypothetical protein IM550_20130 [Microcystis sp. M54BS1]|uniref:COP23 domain-containing protein n=1 Tax=unclassified Microcystis TaxID=2643300 RepID=UPI00257DB998|nr:MULTISPECIES: COP23 domain-containing protein [unclassified Microcystis]MCA2541435.1 hypothetical protein [Microcystis sp. M54BS1]MCA2596312.1 hypothetical protein [Microcystis sp. M38BS1]MCA2612532.1 hypothetical protein [Microcystis sp. M27BS1]MCA2507054.1 hypothetical protein [Microcystis sp. M62BS1]MCA2513285.1 hypothetical protein [Microcystis sp. M60BS1]
MENFFYKTGRYLGMLGVAWLFAVAPLYPSNASPQVKFVCGKQSGAPTTFGISPQWGNQPRALIKWYNNVGKDAGETPESRCSKVTYNLNKHFSQGGQFITYGFMNNNPVVCTTNEEGKGCNNLLFTLDGSTYGWRGQWTEQPKDVLKTLFALSDMNIAPSPLIQSCRLVVDTNAVLMNKTIKASCR